MGGQSVDSLIIKFMFIICLKTVFVKIRMLDRSERDFLWMVNIDFNFNKKVRFVWLLAQEALSLYGVLPCLEGVAHHRITHYYINNTYRLMNGTPILPPEWAPQSMVQLTWPHEGTDWKDCLSDIDATYVSMAEAITRYEKLLIVTPEERRVQHLLEAELTAEQLDRVIFHNCRTNDTWARDHGFITLRASDGSQTLLDFKFNGWGEKFSSDLDNAINRSLYDAGRVYGEYESHLDFVLEGGSIEVDGRGTVFTTSSCLLAPHRNEPLNRVEIERRLCNYLRCERVLWIEHGHLEGDDTDGHIDTLVRTAPQDTLLYIATDDATDCHYADLQAMEEQLHDFKTIDGHPYRLLRLPLPRPVWCEGERLPATYANFLVVNGAVLMPVYDQPDLDQKAMHVVAEAFPGRDVVPIDSRVIVRQHGSVHCCTMQYPIGTR